jgi:hypothetical protein
MEQRMNDMPSDLRDRLTAVGQEHLLLGWDKLAADRRTAFTSELAAIDFEALATLVRAPTY